MSQGERERLSRRGLLFGRFRQAAEVLRNDEPSRPARAPAAPERAVPDPARLRPSNLPLLRPPGAIEESAFLARCTKCGDCQKACPHGAIRPAPERLRGAEGTPIIDAAESPCRLCEDKPCITACATGALSPAIPVRMGTAQIDHTFCLARTGSFCTVCSERCPVPGAIITASGGPRMDISVCVGCGLCHHHCPAPVNAVLLLPLLKRPLPPEAPPHVPAS